MKTVSTGGQIWLEATDQQQRDAEDDARGRAETRKPKLTSQVQLDKDRRGCLAERIVVAWLRERLGEHGIEVFHTALVERGCKHEIDMTIAGKKFDVKSSHAGSDDFLVYECACDYYLPVLFKPPGSIGIYAPVSHEDVRKWPGKEEGELRCYEASGITREMLETRGERLPPRPRYKPVAELAPLVDIKQIVDLLGGV